MKTRRALTLATTLCMAWASQGQDWNANPGGNVINFNEYLGAAAGSTVPLHLRTIPDLSIDFSTSNLLRMRLYPNQVPTINGFAVPTSGFLGLSGNANFFNGVGPFSRLHLADNAFNLIVNAQQSGYRSWQRNGITFTGNGDHSYIGQKFNGLDNTDLLLLWSNDSGPDQFAPDRLTIRFASGFTGAPSGANSDECLEAARFYPVDVTQVNFGLGDFFAGNLADPVNIIDPTERLDVLNGRVRIRALPEHAGEVTTSYKVMVVDDSPAPSAERGVVKWIDPNDLPPTGGSGGADCDWDISSSGNKITTAWKTVNSNGNCPEADWNVGVGTNAPAAKLHVTREVNSGGVNHGGRFELSGTASGKRSLWGNVLGSGTQHTAVRGETVNGTTRNFGLHGIATLEANVTGSENYAGFGEAIVNEAAVCDRNAGMRGEGRVTGNAVDNYGVFGFAGAYGSVSNNQAVRALGTAAANSSVGLNYGLNALANALNNSAVDTNYAVYASASAGAGNVGANYGVYAQATGNNTVARNYGLRALSSGPAGVNYGVFARATGGGTDWAGYFVGNVHATGNVTWSSDEMLKSEIEPLENAMEIIGSLRPKRYNFRTEEFAQLNLPQGSRMGLIAQDVQQVLPVLVQPVSHPEEYDAETGVTHPGVDYLSLNYAELIPLLIAGMQEQQAELEEQRAANVQLMERLDDLDRRFGDLQSALANCCALPGNDADQRMGSIDNSQFSDATSERLLTIAPNPFTDRTTVSYTLERGGRAQLLVNSSDGKHLQVLEEGVRSEGQYNYTWSTAHLAPGVYYVTLLLDGEPLVKRAVKVQ